MERRLLAYDSTSADYERTEYVEVGKAFKLGSQATKPTTTAARDKLTAGDGAAGAARNKTLEKQKVSEQQRVKNNFWTPPPQHIKNGDILQQRWFHSLPPFFVALRTRITSLLRPLQPHFLQQRGSHPPSPAGSILLSTKSSEYM